MYRDPGFFVFDLRDCLQLLTFSSSINQLTPPSIGTGIDHHLLSLLLSPWRPTKSSIVCLISVKVLSTAMWSSTMTLLVAKIRNFNTKWPLNLQSWFVRFRAARCFPTSTSTISCNPCNDATTNKKNFWAWLKPTITNRRPFQTQHFCSTNNGSNNIHPLIHPHSPCKDKGKVLHPPPRIPPPPAPRPTRRWMENSFCPGAFPLSTTKRLSCLVATKPNRRCTTPSLFL